MGKEIIEKTYRRNEKERKFWKEWVEEKAEEIMNGIYSNLKEEDVRKIVETILYNLEKVADVVAELKKIGEEYGKDGQIVGEITLVKILGETSYGYKEANERISAIMKESKEQGVKLLIFTKRKKDILKKATSNHRRMIAEMLSSTPIGGKAHPDQKRFPEGFDDRDDVLDYPINNAEDEIKFSIWYNIIETYERMNGD